MENRLWVLGKHILFMWTNLDNGSNLGVFGSFSRNEQTNESDIDILVEFDYSKSIGIRIFFGLEDFLHSLLGLKIDLVTPSAIKERTIANILGDVVYL